MDAFYVKLFNFFSVLHLSNNCHVVNFELTVWVRIQNSQRDKLT